MEIVQRLYLEMMEIVQDYIQKEKNGDFVQIIFRKDGDCVKIGFRKDGDCVEIRFRKFGDCVEIRFTMQRLDQSIQLC